MLMPIIAAVGSFVVSERILKPKATALFLLTCLALYDLFIAPPKPIALHDAHRDAHDEFVQYQAAYAQQEDDLATSMRCYRGPGLIAVALFCSAYSLRIWRRNGVACDELIFLPDTPHEFRCTSGNDGKQEAPAGSIEPSSTAARRPGSGARRPSSSAGSSSNGTRFAEGDAAAGAANPSGIFHLPTLESFDDEIDNNEHRERSPLMVSHSWDSEQNISTTNSQSPKESPIISLALKGLDMLVVSKQLDRLRPPLHSEDTPRDRLPSGELVPPRQNEVYDAEYAPSGPSVLGAALDLSLPVLFNFHMFCVLMKDHYKREADDHMGVEAVSDASAEAKIDVKEDESFFTPPQLPPTVLPLIFLSSALVRSQIPRKQRQRFFKTVLQGTALTLFKPVRFRDAFVGDCITSLVRPMVDVVFAFTYYCAAVYGFMSRTYGLKETQAIVSNSKFMHGLVLPLFAILPLWYRFLQTLRQAYDTGKRWPYLGNALKYFTAGLVVLYGMTHSTGQRGTWWVVSFVCATIYQIIWDSCMDWELLVIAPSNASEQNDSSVRSSWFSNLRCPSVISSWSPRLFPSRLLGLLVACRKIVCLPVASLSQRGRSALSRMSRIRLRSQRMYDDDMFYWRALFINAALRFCWMMGFIPAYRISILDGSVQETFSQTNSWTFVILATLEIIRCCIWGIIKVELETIKLSNSSEKDLKMAATTDEYLREGMWNDWSTIKPEDAIERSTSATGVLTETDLIAPSQTHRWLGLTVGSGFLQWAFLIELSLWPVAFLGLGYYIIFTDFD
ncbi:hypothetical protein ACHAWX_007654 [Stephanocyclus meneghinianus]